MKTVCYVSPFIPSEWIAAHGLQPCRVRLEWPGGLSRHGTYMGVCPFSQAFMETAMAGDADAFIFATTCDQMRRAADQCLIDAPKPVWMVNVPATWQTTTARAMYVYELQRLGTFLIRLGGQAPTPAALANEMRRQAQTREHLRRLRKDTTPLQFNGLLQQYFSGGPVPPTATQSGSLTGEVRHGLEPSLRNNVPNTSATAVPLALVGEDLFSSQVALFAWIEQCGGYVALDGTTHGERGLLPPFEERQLSQDPFLAMANTYFDNLPEVFHRPNHRLYAWLQERIIARKIRGLLVWHYPWCDLWQAEVPRLQEMLGIPVLLLEAGDSGVLHQTVKNRVQSFLEMLAARTFPLNRPPEVV